jgi:hypothetical protein
MNYENLEVRESMMLKPMGDLRRGFAALMTAYNAQRVGAPTREPSHLESQSVPLRRLCSTLKSAVSLDAPSPSFKGCNG